MIRILILFSLISLFPALSQAELPRATERFEQMLIQAPGPGRAFDEVFSHFAARNAIHELEARWQQALEQQSAQAWNYHLLLGLLNHRNGHLDTAAEHYRQASELRPEDYRSYAYHGQALASASRFTEAIEQLQQAITHPIPPVEARNVYGELARLQQRAQLPEQATDTWLKLGALFPDDPQILEEVGDALLEHNRYDEAQESYQKMIAASSHDSYQQLLGQLKIAELLERSQKIEEALQLYTETLNHTHPGSWLYREVATRIQRSFRRRNDIDGLLEFYKQRHADQPQDIASGRELARLHVETGNREAALSLLAELVDKSPQDYELHYQYALLLIQEQQYETATTILEPLVQRQPTVWGYREALGEMQLALLRQQNHQDFSVVINTWEALVPDHQASVSSLLRLADLYRRHQLNEPALAASRRALALDPEAYDLRVRVAEFLFELEQEKEAWQILRNDQQPLSHPSDYQRLAQIELKRGLYDEALTTVDQGLQLAPDSFPLLDLKWQILHRRKDWPEATAMLDILLEHTPNEETTEQIEQRHIHLLRISAALQPFQQTIREKLAQDEIPTEHELRLYLRSRLTSGHASLAQELQKSLNAYPKSFLIARLHSQSLAQSGQIEPQINSLRHLMTLRPERSPEWLRAIIKIHLDHGQTRQAREVLNELAILSPDDPEIDLQRSELAYKEGKLAEGHQFLRQAIRLSGNPESLRIKLAEQLLATGAASEALPLLEEIFAESQSTSTRLMVIPLLVQAARQTGTLEAYGSRFLTRDATLRNTPEYHLFRGEFYAKNHDYTQAAIEWKQGLDIDPQHSQLLSNSIEAAQFSSDYAILQSLQELVYRQDSSPENALNLALSMIDNDQIEPALELLNQSNQGIFDHPEVLWQIVEATLGTRIQASLLTILTDQIRKQPESLAQPLTLAQIQIYTKQLDQAKETLWSILQQAPFIDIYAPENDLGASAGTAVWTGSWLEQIQRFQHASHTNAARYQTSSQYAYGLFHNQLIHTRPVSQYLHQRANDPFLSALTSPQPIEVYLHSLIYLAGIAIHEQEEAAFLETLEQWLEDSSQPDEFKVIAYNILEARPALEAWIQDRLQREEYDEELYGFIAYSLRNNARGQLHLPQHSRSQALYEQLTEAMLQHNHPMTPEIMIWKASYLFEEGELQSSLELLNRILQETEQDITAEYSHFQILSLKMRIGEREKKREIGKEVLDILESSLSHLAYSFKVPLVNSFLRYFSQDEIDDAEWTQIARLLTDNSGPFLPLSSSLRSLDAFPVTSTYYPANTHFLLNTLLSPSDTIEITPLWRALEKQIEENTPNKYAAQTLLFISKGLHNQREEALAIAQDLLDDAPDAGTWYNTGLLLAQSNQFQEALHHFQQIVSPTSDLYLPAQLHILKYAHQLGDQSLARDTANRIVSLQIPDSFMSHMNMVSAEFNHLGIPLPGQPRNRPYVFRTRQSQQNQRFYAYHEGLLRAEQSQNAQQQIHFAQLLLRETPLFNWPEYRSYESYRQQALRVLQRNAIMEAYHSDLQRRNETRPNHVDTLQRLIEYHQFHNHIEQAYHYFHELLVLTPRDNELISQYLFFLGKHNKHEELIHYLNTNPPQFFYRVLGQQLAAMIHSPALSQSLPILDYLLDKGHIELVMSLVNQDLRKFPGWDHQIQHNAVQHYLGMARYLKKKNYPQESLALWKMILSLPSRHALLFVHLSNYPLSDLYDLCREQQIPLLEVTSLIMDSLLGHSVVSPSPEKFLLFVETRSRTPRQQQGLWQSIHTHSGRHWIPFLSPFEILTDEQDILDLLDELSTRTADSHGHHLLNHYFKSRLYDLETLTEIPETLELVVSSEKAPINLLNHRLNLLFTYIDGIYFWPNAKPLFEDILKEQTSVPHQPHLPHQMHNSGAHSPHFRLLQAELALEAGNIEEAEVHLENIRKSMTDKQIQLFYNHSSIQANLIRLYQESGSFEQAQSFYQEYQQLLSSNSHNRSQATIIQNWFSLLEKNPDLKVEATVWAPLTEEKDTLRIAWELHPQFEHFPYKEFGKSLRMSLDPLNGVYNMKLEILTAPQGSVLETFEFAAIPARGEQLIHTAYPAGYLRTSFSSTEEAPQVLSPRTLPFSKTPNLVDNPKLEFEPDLLHNRLRFPGWSLPTVLPTQRRGGPAINDNSHTAILLPFSQRVFRTTSAPILLDPDQSYLFSGWVYTDNSSTLQIKLQYLDITGTHIHTRNFPMHYGSENSVWVYLNHEFFTGHRQIHAQQRQPVPGAVAVQIEIEGRTNLRFNDLSLRKFNPEPPQQTNLP